MFFTFTDLANAIVGYYLIVLGVSAAAGVRASLRDPAAAATAPLAPTTAAPSPSTAATASPAARARFGALVQGRTLHATHRFGWATGVGAALGWLAGVEMYRAGRRATIAGARRVSDWRASRRGAARPDETEPAGPEAPEQAPPPQPAAPVAPEPADAPPAEIEEAPALAVEPPDTEPVDAELIEEHQPEQASPATGPVLAALAARPGRTPLYLVPPPQEYPPIMAAADIYDLESLIHFTDQVTDASGLEAEDAAAAAASMIAGAEFAAETATRVAEESASLEAAVAAMAMLRVDPESVAAYHALLEAGQVYRDTTATFSAQCHDAAFTAAQMSAAATHYRESADRALAVLNAHQMPHAEAAGATGHSGAHGAFYGVADTSGQHAVAPSGAPQLPAS